MSVRLVLQWPDPRLSLVCAPVAEMSGIADLVADMFDTLYQAKGRGLAAPQIGVMQRVFVMDTGWKDGTPDPIALINPVVTDQSAEEFEGEEMCLSIPGVSAHVMRPERVTMSYLDPNGTECRQTFDGFAARCALHELDHINGRVTLDHMSQAERADMLARYEALA